MVHMRAGPPPSNMHASLHLQGCLPTFLDIGESFSASAINEDNLLSQMRESGMRIVGGGKNARG